MSITGIPSDMLRGLLLSVGSHRGERPFSPVEVARALERARSAGNSMSEIAEALHLDGSTMIGRFRRLLSLPAEVQLITDWGTGSSTIAFTAASELARLPDGVDQSEAAVAALEHGLTSSEIKALVQRRLRSGKPVKECVSEIVALRPVKERRYVFIGGVVDGRTQQLLAELTQRERDVLLRRVVRTRYPTLDEFGGRLGTDRFTVTGSEDVAAQLRGDEVGFERGIAGDLTAKICT